MIYLDNNATTRPADEVAAAVHEALTVHWANPSSIHRAGQAVRGRVELARREVARLIGAKPAEIVFTSGGTEAANLALASCLCPPRKRPVVVTSRVEHSAVREAVEAYEKRGVEAVWLPVDRRGRVDPDALDDVLRERGNEVAVVSVQWANNETGVIQPVEAVGEVAQARGVPVHVDGTQWVGKMPSDVEASPFQFLSFAPHKFHGPKGVGALWARRGTRLAPRVIGGPQEMGRRGGTENVSGILGFGAAARLAIEWLETDGRERTRALRDRFERGLRERIPDLRVNGDDVERLWNTSNVVFPGLDAEPILIGLSERGVCASAGAACSSGSLEPSPVLKAMGLSDEDAAGSVRFSLSRETTPEEIDEALHAIAAVVDPLRALRAVR